jgi:hypothetical protein
MVSGSSVPSMMLHVSLVSTPCVGVFLCLAWMGATAKAAANGRGPTVTGFAGVDESSPTLNGNRPTKSLSVENRCLLRGEVG